MDDVEINGECFTVTLALCKNRNASARLRDGMIALSIPSRWPAHIRDKIAKNLLKRAIKSIQSGRWNPEHGKSLRFFDGQTISAMGRRFRIRLSYANRSRARVLDDEMHISMPDGPGRDERVASIIRREIAKAVGPDLQKRVSLFNASHFGGSVPKIAIKDTKTRWGSCAPDGSISLNFRLLFMPSEILDYVIVHELAHTRYRGHGPRFWELVGKVIPDHKERRRGLRENGWKYPKAQDGRDEPCRSQLIECVHEPDETY